MLVMRTKSVQGWYAGGGEWKKEAETGAYCYRKVDIGQSASAHSPTYSIYNTYGVYTYIYRIHRGPYIQWARVIVMSPWLHGGN